MLYDVYDVTVSFTKNLYGEATMLVEIEDFALIEFMKYQETELASFEGTYYSKELKNSYIISSSSSNLILKHPRLDNILLKQINKNFFSSSNRNFSGVRFYGNGNDEIHGFEATNDGVWNLEFRKGYRN